MYSFSGCIFVAGGLQNDDKVLDKCEVYRFKSSKWTEVSSMNTKRDAFALIYFQDKIQAIGDWSNEKIIDTIETYDLGENKWTTIDTKLLTKRIGHSAVVHNTRFFVIGGANVQILSSVEIYSSETNQLSFVSSMNLSRADFGCCLINSSVYVIGGIFAPADCKVTDKVEIYDIEKDEWKKGPSLPVKLAGVVCSSTE